MRLGADDIVFTRSTRGGYWYIWSCTLWIWYILLFQPFFFIFSVLANLLRALAFCHTHSSEKLVRMMSLFLW